MPLHAHRSPVQPARASNLAIAEALPPRTSNGAQAGARARRASRTREAHDGWTFVVIPPGAGARPRTLRVSVRRLRMAAIALVTIIGTGVASGTLLAILLSMAPTMQPEARGVQLGVLAGADVAPAADSASGATAVDGALPGSGSVRSGTPDVVADRSPASGSARAPRSSIAKPVATATRRRVIEPPSMSGRRTAAAPREGAIVAEASAHGLPVIGRITSRFSSARTHPLLGVVRRHNGVDIAAPSGTPITAAASGRVVFAGRKFGFGNTVEIDHGNGVLTRYAHARSIKVRGGARVEPGDVIATVGRTGLASGPHLHYEVLLNGVSVDPLKRSVGVLLSGASGDPTAAVQPPAGATSETPATGAADSVAAPAAADSAGGPPQAPAPAVPAPLPGSGVDG